MQALSGHKAIVVWCNGSTTGFGSVCPGSNPGTTACKGHLRNNYVSFRNKSNRHELTFLSCGTNVNVNGTSRVFYPGNVPYLCGVSFHAHIWLVIDFRDVSPSVREDREADPKETAPQRSLLFFCTVFRGVNVQ